MDDDDARPTRVRWKVMTFLCVLSFLTYFDRFNIVRAQGAWLPVRSRARWGGMLWLMARWGGAFSPLIVGSMLRGFDSPGFRRAVTGTPLEHTAAWRFGFWVCGVVGVLWVLAFRP